MSVKIDLPFPPSVNNLFSQTRTGRRFPSKRYTAWRRQTDWAIVSARLDKSRFSYPVNVHIQLIPRDNRARDGDNFLKPLLDSLVRTGVLTDDSNQYVNDVSVSWLPADKAASRATVTIVSASRPGGQLSTLELTRRD